MPSKTVVKCIAVAFCLLLVLSEFANSAPSYMENEQYKNMIDFLLSSGLLDQHSDHRLVRKGGRDPAVRLRFGRRSDPYWQNYFNDNSAENTTN